MCTHGYRWKDGYMDPFRCISHSNLLVLTGGVPNCGFEIDELGVCMTLMRPPPTKSCVICNSFAEPWPYLYQLLTEVFQYHQL